MNTRALCSLLLVLSLHMPAYAVYARASDNPFVEAMLRMMVVVGLIDPHRAWPGFPYALSPGGFPSPGAPPGAFPPGPRTGAAGGWHGHPGGHARVDNLDGIWEISNGGILIVRGRSARLFVDRNRWQDFLIGYDGKMFWWHPRGSNTTTHYRYLMRDGRMILRDNKNNVLLMRRRN